jgi:hypothetical protein
MCEVYMFQPVTSGHQLFGSPCGSHVTEPDLDEVMRDPMTLALMAADRVNHSELSALFAQVRSNLR